MNEVIANFGRLEWWVNTVIVALLVTLLAGFTRDLVLNWLSGLGGWFQQRARDNRKKIVRAARLIGDDVQLHISYIFTSVLRLFAVLMVLLYSTLIGPLHLFYKSFPDYDPVRNFLHIPVMGSTATGLLSMATLVIFLPLFFGLGRRFDVLRLVRRKAVRRAVRFRRS